MRRAVLIAAVLALLAPGSALARECGIPDSNPLWVDFAGHDAPLPQKPGLGIELNLDALEKYAVQSLERAADRPIVWRGGLQRMAGAAYGD